MRHFLRYSLGQWIVLVSLISLSIGIDYQTFVTAAPQLALAPTGYDRLHHASPSTQWTVFAGRGVNAVLGNFVRQEQDMAVPGRGLPVDRKSVV